MLLSKVDNDFDGEKRKEKVQHALHPKGKLSCRALYHSHFKVFR